MLLGRSSAGVLRVRYGLVLVPSVLLVGCSLLLGDDLIGVADQEVSDAEVAADRSEVPDVSAPADAGVDVEIDTDVDAGPPARIYVLGGSDNSSSLPKDPEELYADILDDGSLGPWQETAVAPVGTRMNHGAVRGPGFVATVGGFAGAEIAGGGEQATITVGRLGDDGLVTAFWNSNAMLLLTRRAYNGAAFHAGYLYAIGGVSIGGTVLSDVVVGSVNATSAGTFAVTSSLPNPTSRMAVATSATRLYVAGGANGATKHNAIVKAAFGANGSLSEFTPAGTLPSARSYLQVVIYQSTLIAVGGADTNELSEVVLYAIDSEGNLGEPRTTSALPSGISRHQAVVYRDRLYVIGGGGTPRSDVLVGKLEDDGSVLAWSATTPLPSPRIFHAAVVVE